MSNLLLVYAVSGWFFSLFYEFKDTTTISSVSFPTSLCSDPTAPSVLPSVDLILTQEILYIS